MEKKDYINNIILACNKMLEYEELLTNLGGSIEELFWDIADPESVRDKLAEHEYTIEEKFGYKMYRMMLVLAQYDRSLKEYKTNSDIPDIFKALIGIIDNVFGSLLDLKKDIEYIKKMSSEDVLAIRSIMGQVKLLRDTLIWVGNGD